MAISAEIEVVTGRDVVKGEDAASIQVPRVEIAADVAVVSIHDGPSDSLNSDLQSLIQRRTSNWTAPLAKAIASAALSWSDVELRVQKSRNEPTYFQVRTPKFRQVMAYVNLYPDYLRVDYRLAQDHQTYGIAESRDGFYGISLKVSQQADVATVVQLLRDAHERPD